MRSYIVPEAVEVVRQSFEPGPDGADIVVSRVFSYKARQKVTPATDLEAEVLAQIATPVPGPADGTEGGE